MQLSRQRTRRSRPRTERIGTGWPASHLGAAGRIEAGTRMIYGEVGRLADESLRLGLRQADIRILVGDRHRLVLGIRSGSTGFVRSRTLLSGTGTW